jgi:periplasmic protein CpxP/Spy
MKKTIMLLAAAVLIAGVSLAYAQTGTRPPRNAGGPQNGAQWQGRGPGFMDQLNLTDDQKAKVKTIMEDQAAKIQVIRNATESQIDAVLTPEQKAKLDQLRKEAQEKMKERMEKNKAAAGTETPAAK